MSKKRASNEQLESLVSWIEETPALATRHHGQNGRSQNDDAWSTLAGTLNAIGLGTIKTGEKWYQAWRDLKNNVKRKSARLRMERSRTGGDPCGAIPLTSLEERVLAIIGPEAVFGLDGVETLPPAMNSVEVVMDFLDTHEETSQLSPDVVEESPSFVEPETPRPEKRKFTTEPVPCTKRKAVSLEDRFLSLEEKKVGIEERRQISDERRLDLEERRRKSDEKRINLEERRQIWHERRLNLEERRQTSDEKRLDLEERRQLSDDRRLNLEERRWIGMDKLLTDCLQILKQTNSK